MRRAHCLERVSVAPPVVQKTPDPSWSTFLVGCIDEQYLTRMHRRPAALQSHPAVVSPSRAAHFRASQAEPRPTSQSMPSDCSPVRRVIAHTQSRRTVNAQEREHGQTDPRTFHDFLLEPLLYFGTNGESTATLLDPAPASELCAYLVGGVPPGRFGHASSRRCNSTILCMY